MLSPIISSNRRWSKVLGFSNDYYGLNFRTKQSVELFCAYSISEKDWKSVNNYWIIVIPWYTTIYSSKTINDSKTRCIYVYNEYMEVYTCESDCWIKEKLGLTQTRLGEEIGVSQQTISKYENGDENISGDMLLALSKFLGFQLTIYWGKRKNSNSRSKMTEKKLWNCTGIWINITEILGLLLGKDYWVVNYISIMKIVFWGNSLGR